jgi:hypothetical protein
MNVSIRNCLRRVLQILEALMILPLFLFVMIIPLEIALASRLFSDWLRNQNW